MANGGEGGEGMVRGWGGRANASRHGARVKIQGSLFCSFPYAKDLYLNACTGAIRVLIEFKNHKNPALTR